MDPIKGMNQIAQILRQKLGERGTSHIKAGAAGNASTAGTTTANASKASAEEIKRRIGDRIRALPVDKRKSSKAAQIFVELVITWEFGEQLLQDPQFSELSTEVVDTMAKNPAAWEKMQKLLEEFIRMA